MKRETMGKGARLYVPLISRVGAAGVHSSGENKSQHCGLGQDFYLLYENVVATSYSFARHVFLSSL